jgi:hypothetical protein
MQGHPIPSEAAGKTLPKSTCRQIARRKFRLSAQNLLTESRTSFNLRALRRRSQVAKAAVCKTAIRGFESHRRLFLFLPFSAFATFRRLRAIPRQVLKRQDVRACFLAVVSAAFSR